MEEDSGLRDILRSACSDICLTMGEKILSTYNGPVRVKERHQSGATFISLFCYFVICY